MVARHLVLVPGPDGSPIRVAMKSWLKAHPQTLPGIDLASLTSHQQRKLLQREGWTLEIGSEEVLVISPALPADQIDDFTAAFEAEDESKDDTEASDEATLSFELEHQLRDFIIANLGAIPIEGKKLHLYKDSAGKSGREYPTGVGFIDILAEDDAGVLYVFELKRGKSADHTVGQILRYMGWLKHHAATAVEVRGIIVAKSLGEKLKYAVSAVPGLHAFGYDVTFSLKPDSLI